MKKRRVINRFSESKLIHAISALFADHIFLDISSSPPPSLLMMMMMMTMTMMKMTMRGWCFLRSISHHHSNMVNTTPLMIDQPKMMMMMRRRRRREERRGRRGGNGEEVRGKIEGNASPAYRWLGGMMERFVVFAMKTALRWYIGRRCKDEVDMKRWIGRRRSCLHVSSLFWWLETWCALLFDVALLLLPLQRKWGRFDSFLYRWCARSMNERWRSGWHKRRSEWTAREVSMCAPPLRCCSSPAITRLYTGTQVPLPFLFLSHPIPSFPILSHLILSHPIPFFPIFDFHFAILKLCNQIIN